MSRWLSAVLNGIRWFAPTALRLLLAFMLTNNGWRWLHRPDGVAYLTDAVTTLLDRGQTVGVYRPFLTDVVLPNAEVFAFLVSWGEFLSGLSLALGLASRLGAAVAAFQFLNYGLMGGFLSVFFHGILIAMLAVTVIGKSGRKFGIDRWLHARRQIPFLW